MEFVAKNLPTRKTPNSEGIFHQEKSKFYQICKEEITSILHKLFWKLKKKSHGFQRILWGQHYLHIKAVKDIIGKGHYRAILLRNLSQPQFPSLFNGPLGEPKGTEWAEGLECSQTAAAAQEGRVVEVALVRACSRGSGRASSAWAASRAQRPPLGGVFWSRSTRLDAWREQVLLLYFVNYYIAKEWSLLSTILQE